VRFSCYRFGIENFSKCICNPKTSMFLEKCRLNQAASYNFPIPGRMLEMSIQFGKEGSALHARLSF
jgi:hypothetical protein